MNNPLLSQQYYNTNIRLGWQKYHKSKAFVLSRMSRVKFALIRLWRVNERRSPIFNSLLVCILLMGGLFVSCSQDKDILIGVSQCSEDIWRYKQNHELKIGCYAHSDVKLEIASAEDDDMKQIEQIENFIKKKVDLLIVAPNSVVPLSSVIDKAYDSGIPVIYFDRKTNSNKYTAFMGADNYEIGYTMGNLIANRMGGKGTLVEIRGLKGSSPAMDRHRGFAKALANFPKINVISCGEDNWTEKSGRKAMKEVLRNTTDIQCVFGHNDRLALGARSVAMAHGLTDIRYFGVDALPTSGGGLEQVKKGALEATYIYPTQGLELMQLALKIIRGKRFARNNMLHSAVVDKSNADLLLMQYQEFSRISDNIDALHGKLDIYFDKINTQRNVIVIFVVVLVIIIGLCVLVYRLYLTKILVHEEVATEVVSPLITDATTHGLSDSFLDRFRTILQQNLHDADFNVERIGEEMGMSRVQLYRKVKSLTGMTPVELLRKARLARGRQLLEVTDHSISEIAYDVGFTAPSYFAKCFKDEFGMKPGEVRNNI